MVVLNELLDNMPDYNKNDVHKQEGRVSFVQALNDKYVEQDEFDNQHKVAKDNSISTEITFVGFGEVTSVQKQLRGLVSIDLSGRNIEIAGNLDEIKGSLERVMILNLADNQLDWHELINILTCVPSLRELILTGNNLRANEIIEYPETTHKRLTSLVLGRVNLKWQDAIDILSRIWTSIDHLDIWDNQLTEESMRLTDRDANRPFMEKMTSLALSQNCFIDLAWLPDMGQLYNLVELDVSSCQLKTSHINTTIAKYLKDLKVLNISHNNIADWQDLAYLNSLNNMTSLICNDNPFFFTEKLARLLTVAQIARLKTLNREIVTNTFRRDSEITFIRKVFPEYKAYRDGHNDKFKQLYPRYEELLEVYELPEDLNSKQTVDEKYVTVELCHNGKIVSKKLPCDMRVSNLHMLCKRLFKIRPSSRIEIVCCVADTPEEGISYPLDQEGQTLHFFSVKSNNRLIIKL